MKADKNSKRSQLKRHKAKNRRNKSACVVYGLFADDGIIAYIGQTRCLLATRLKFHLKAAETRGSNVQRWIRERVQAGEQIGIMALDAKAVWNVTEVVMIERYRAKGHALLNMTDGGGSPPLKMLRKWKAKRKGNCGLTPTDTR